jgi:hypothetical protein
VERFTTRKTPTTGQLDVIWVLASTSCRRKSLNFCWKLGIGGGALGGGAAVGLPQTLGRLRSPASE